MRVRVAALATTLLAGCGRLYFDPLVRAGDGGTATNGDGGGLQPGDGSTAPRLAFVSAAELVPTAGLAGADALCAAEAAALPGTFRALLAATDTSAASRFFAGGAWQRVDGIEVTRDLAAFQTALDRDAAGMQRIVEVWTGSSSPLESNNGPGTTCDDWRINLVEYGGLVGSSGSSGAAAFSANLNTCDALGVHVYCLQQ